MAGPRVLELGRGRRLVDLDFRDTEGLVAAYLTPGDDGWTLIETGPASCRDALLRGLGAAGVAPTEVRRVLVTHIHLDHAGGVGALTDALPRAEFFAHAAGVPHLVDPTKLVASARRAWGAAMDRLWGPVVAVPAARIHSLVGGERFPVHGGEIVAVATPGHAKHHVAFFDTATRGLYTGDAAGVRLERSSRLRPAIPPPDLDLDLLFGSVEAMRALDPSAVLLSHFGPTPDGARDLAQYRTVVERWRDAAIAAAREQPTVEHIADALRRLDAAPTPARPEDRESLVSGYELAAMGLLRYFETRGAIPRSSS